MAWVGEHPALDLSAEKENLHRRPFSRQQETYQYCPKRITKYRIIDIVLCYAVQVAVGISISVIRGKMWNILTTTIILTKQHPWSHQFSLRKVNHFIIWNEQDLLFWRKLKIVEYELIWYNIPICGLSETY